MSHSKDSDDDEDNDNDDIYDAADDVYYGWASARKAQPQCVSNGVTSFLHCTNLSTWR